MHPYEVATTLRERGKQDSVRLNYGSLYAVVQTLQRRGLIEARETAREGKLPERTVYRITDSGKVEMHDWLSEMLAVPSREYPQFEAALSFLPALAPDQAVSLLAERAMRLEVAIAGSRAVRQLVENKGLPRLFWVEAEFALVLKQAELDYVKQLIADISSGALEGLGWWRAIHESNGENQEVNAWDWPSSTDTTNDREGDHDG
jgi:DNA-binding PadR family transcriptional regulator